MSKQQPNDLKKEKPDFSAVRKLIQEQMTARSVPSLSVAVARHGEILWEEGYGWADRENRVRATEHTPYYLASVTKSVTATAIMILQERKQLNLDHPVNEYLGSTQVSSPLWDPAQATVRRVATHTAGLTTFARNYYEGQPGSRLSADETIRRYGILFWPPGDRFDYSNLGYGILGEVVARVTGKSYADFVRQEVFWPLGMNRASLGIGPGLEKYAAVRYSSDHPRPPLAESATPGASGIYCSIHDLALFGIFHLKAHRPDQKAILSDAAIDTMQNSTVDTGGGRYGLGWWIDESYFGYRGVLGQGGTDDAQAWLRLIPSEEIVVAALSNTGDPLPNTVIQEALSVLLPPFRERRAKAGADKPPERTEVNLPAPSLTGEWVGVVKTYRGDVPLALSVASDGDVHAKLGSQLTTLLNDAQFSEKGLSGRISGELGIAEDIGPPPNVLHFYLDLRGETLYGAVEAQSRPEMRYGARLSYWVALKKQSQPNKRPP
jgi:CubicO group peptidase (beta-lactamase class C family)